MLLAAFASTALLMGVAGGPHCLAMCAAPCAAMVGAGRGAHEATSPVHWRASVRLDGRTVAFHAARVVGYAGLGAMAALAMESLAWVTQQTMALRPVWTLMHVAVLAWGVLMMAQARQPAWVENAGRAVWRRVQPVVAAPGGVLAAGLLWALMPCGLLYSALLVAALSGGPLQGALAMALFALGSGLWLVAGPWAWQRLRLRFNAARAEWGTRVAGLLLVCVALAALWMEFIYKPSMWCR